MRKYKYPIGMKMFVQNDISFQIEKWSTLQKGVNNIWKIISFNCFLRYFFNFHAENLFRSVVYPNFLISEIKSDYTKTRKCLQSRRPRTNHTRPILGIFALKCYLAFLSYFNEYLQQTKESMVASSLALYHQRPWGFVHKKWKIKLKWKISKSIPATVSCR